MLKDSKTWRAFPVQAASSESVPPTSPLVGTPVAALWSLPSKSIATTADDPVYAFVRLQSLTQSVTGCFSQNSRRGQEML